MTTKMIDMALRRIVIREGSEFQYIYLVERDGHRGFPIVIGTNEARELHRVVARVEVGRPLTHQLALSIVEGLDSKIVRCDIVDMIKNTYFAKLVLRSPDSPEAEIEIDARPSDAIALAMRAGAPIRVVEKVLEDVRTDDQEADPLPDEIEGEVEGSEGDPGGDPEGDPGAEEDPEAK